MRAAVLAVAGSPVRVEEIRLPVPKQGEVRIKVAACGVCRSDLKVARGDLEFPAPCVLGHEISGTVDSAGPGVEGLRPGDRVVSSFIMPCGLCAECLRGRDDFCETYFAMNRARGTLYDGTTRLFRPDGAPLAMQMMGGLAEYAVVPATDVFRLGGALPLEESCILGCAIMTAYGAARNAAEIRPGQTVAVVGAGGVGSNIIQICRLFGAKEVIAVDVREEKLAAAREMGATGSVNASGEDPVARVLALTGGRGVDAAIEALGRPETIEKTFRMARPGGKVVLVGVAPSRAQVGLEINRIVRRGIQIVGSFGCRVRIDMPELIRLAEQGRIDVGRSITRRYRLDQIEEAYRAMERDEIVGRAIVIL